MLAGGERVLVAVSGGADSLALLDLLHELAPGLSLSLEVIHVHHGLRPEADADAELVGRLAADLGLPVHVARVSVPREAPGEGLEAEARRARYAALRARAAACGASHIATGHTADDQAETVLMRLLAGAGPRGLAAIAPVRGSVIRPLLDVRRSQIEAHLRERGLTWAEDATNRDVRFLRNRIRHQVLPVLADAFGAGVVEALCRSASLTRRLVSELEQRARSALGRLGRRHPHGIVFSAPLLLELGEDLAAEVLLRAAAELGEERPLRRASHRALRRMLASEPARRPLGLGRLVVERSGPWLRIGPRDLPALTSREWPVPGVLELAELGLRLEARHFARPRDYAPPREPERVAFDADRVRRLTVRARRRGDRFTPFPGPGERRLKSFLIDAGVPRWERSRLPLLESGSEIIWVAGVRRAAAAPVTSDTRRILEVTLRSLWRAAGTPE